MSTNPVLALAQAQEAWRDFKRSQAEMDRLRGYARMTAGMRSDFAVASALYDRSRATLDRVLGGAA